MIGDILNGRRDAKVENAIAKSLRKLSQRDAGNEIFQFLRTDSCFREYQRHKIGLLFANRVLRNKEQCYRILKLCLTISDASTMVFWIRALGTRLGHRKLLRFYLFNASRYPAQVQWAAYWYHHRFLLEVERHNCTNLLSRLESLIQDDSKGADGS